MPTSKSVIPMSQCYKQSFSSIIVPLLEGDRVAGKWELLKIRIEDVFVIGFVC